jgi:hypothetical protein
VVERDAQLVLPEDLARRVVKQVAFSSLDCCDIHCAAISPWYRYEKKSEVPRNKV